ncbi:hypothetical protein L6164_013157 [Bauhinia variegata]|uniref:Uncharacterized protein n=1 Tax=Bauhinia variegata TaxID=167791 RepID=A0ACB9PBG5_BAUVA|nr:hypothetical protein L6164_013157 [Bauhinia variegata]
MSSNATNKKQNAASTPSDEDHTMKLPENILVHLLSLLPTKDAVAMGIQSHHWKDKWKLISNLHFDDTMLYSNERAASEDSFVKFVHNVLQNLLSINIHSFKLALSKKYNPGDVNSWIFSSLRRGVEKVYLDGIIPSLPENLFGCNTLVELELSTDCSISVPCFVCLENLKILKLVRVKFVVDCLGEPKEQVLSFPVLKSFEAELCIWSKVHDIVLQAPLLENFKMDYLLMNFYRNGASSSAVKIFASQLRNFSYKCNGSEDIILLDESTILDASVDVFVPYDVNNDIYQIGVKVGKLVRQFRGLECLKLGFNLVQVLSNVKDYILTLPMFERLVHLELSFFCYSPSQNILLKLLHNAPALRKLVLLFGSVNFDTNILSSDVVPRCVVSNLKSVELIIYDWDESILCLAKYMLEHSHVLELMIVSLRTTAAKDDATMKVEEVLLKALKVSASATIQVERIVT